MKLLDLVHRSAVPLPWYEGDNIPWDDPEFSERMLEEHLSQNHDAASRRFEKIERHIAWIHHTLLLGRPTKILDLGCGPGLYTSRFSKLRHECVGMDYSPASIGYAVDHANKEHLRCTYLHQDIRSAEYGSEFGLVMLIFGEFNVFSPKDARKILENAHRALVDNGLLLLEPQPFAAIRSTGERGTSWYSSLKGLFSDKPHLCLEEHFWNSDSQTATTRFFIVDTSTGDVMRYAQTFQAYTRADYQSMLGECGFEDVEFFPSLTGEEDESQSDLMAIVARKRDDA